MVKIAFILSTV